MSGKPEVIGLFLRSAENAYQRQLKAVAVREAKHRGFELVIRSVKFDADEQVAQIREAIANAATLGLVGILVSGVRDEDLVPLAHQAADAGLAWAVVNDAAFVDEVRQQHPDRAIFTASGDQVEIGRVQAHQIQALLGKQGRVMCITGNWRNIEAHRRLEGLKLGLGEGFEVVELNSDWTSEGARLVMESWASKLETQASIPAAFAAQNDEMALGVRQALRDFDSRWDWPVGGLPIVGCDGAEDFGQRLVREGRIKATVIMAPASGAAIEWIARARHKGELPPVHVVMPAVSFPALSRLK